MRSARHSGPSHIESARRDEEANLSARGQSGRRATGYTRKSRAWNQTGTGEMQADACGIADNMWWRLSVHTASENQENEIYLEYDGTSVDRGRSFCAIQKMRQQGQTLGQHDHCRRPRAHRKCLLMRDVGRRVAVRLITRAHFLHFLPEKREISLPARRSCSVSS